MPRVASCFVRARGVSYHFLPTLRAAGNLAIDFSRHRARTITEDDYRILVSPGCNARPSPSTISLRSRISPRPTTSFTIDFRRWLSHNLPQGRPSLHLRDFTSHFHSVSQLYFLFRLAIISFEAFVARFLACFIAMIYRAQRKRGHSGSPVRSPARLNLLARQLHGSQPVPTLLIALH